MDQEKAIKELKAAWRGDGRVTVERVDVIQYTVDGYSGRAHPFMIGPRHVAFASDHRGGMLSQEAIDASGVGCYRPDRAKGEPRCNQPASAHHAEYGLFVRLTEDIDEKTLAGWLKALKPEMEAQGVGGFAFMGTDQYSVLRDGVAVLGPGSGPGAGRDAR